MSLSARTLHRLASVLGRSSAADISAALAGGASAYGPPIDFAYEGTVDSGGDDFAAAKKVHLPTDAALYCVSGHSPRAQDAQPRTSGGLVVIENAAHWDHWWGDGSNFEYPTNNAMGPQVIWPGGDAATNVNIPLMVIAAGGWYVVPFHDVAIDSIVPIA